MPEGRLVLGIFLRNFFRGFLISLGDRELTYAYTARPSRVRWVRPPPSRVRRRDSRARTPPGARRRGACACGCPCPHTHTHARGHATRGTRVLLSRAEIYHRTRSITRRSVFHHTIAQHRSPQVAENKRLARDHPKLPQWSVSPLRLLPSAASG